MPHPSPSREKAGGCVAWDRSPALSGPQPPQEASFGCGSCAEGDEQRGHRRALCFEPSALHFPAARAEHLGIASPSEVRRCLPAEESSHPGWGWGGVPPPGFGFPSVHWTKKVLEIRAVGGHGICGGLPALVTAVAGTPWDWTWKIKIKPSLQR